MGLSTWDVEYTDEFEQWWSELTEEGQDRVAAAVEKLEEVGPVLGRPWVDTVTASRHANMKELRPLRLNRDEPRRHQSGRSRRRQDAALRVLFVFDPRRTAILLLGGDKSGNWREWYDKAIPTADRLYDEHLRQIQTERNT